MCFEFNNCFKCPHPDCTNDKPAPENIDSYTGIKSSTTEKRKAYYREYQRNHKRKMTPEQAEYWKAYHREYNKKYYELHREEIIAIKSEYQKKNYPAIKKRRADKNCASVSKIASNVNTQTV